MTEHPFLHECGKVKVSVLRSIRGFDPLGKRLEAITSAGSQMDVKHVISLCAEDEMNSKLKEHKDKMKCETFRGGLSL